MQDTDFTRVLVMGDTHCGSVTGLTPPAYEQMPEPGTDAFELYELRRWLYDNWRDTIEAWKPFDVAIFNGDLIDGDQSRSNGWELLTLDRMEQAAMATHLVKQVDAPVNKFVAGTAYHVGQDEDFEQLVADAFGERVQKEQLVKLPNGVVFHAFHHASGSQLQHTRQNALGREIQDMVFRLQKGRIDTDHVDVLVRSHVHYSGFMGDHDMAAYRVPALQLENGHKWARRFSSSTMDYGVLIFDAYRPGMVDARMRVWTLPPKTVDILEGLVDSASAEMRKTGIELLVKNPPVVSAVPQGYVGAK